jgi:hypothetical protein
LLRSFPLRGFQRRAMSRILKEENGRPERRAPSKRCIATSRPSVSFRTQCFN